ncbi:hypothetical protein D1872_290130 [compost metagenome]
MIVFLYPTSKLLSLKISLYPSSVKPSGFSSSPLWATSLAGSLKDANTICKIGYRHARVSTVNSV